MNRGEVVGVLVCVLAICVGQGLFKHVGIQIRNGELLNSFRVAVPAIASIVIYASATILWIILLKNIPLSKAYSFMALSYILVPLIGLFAFNEPITIKFIVGSALILGGIIVVATQ